MSTFDTLVGLDHALVKTWLKTLRQQPEQHREAYIADVIAKQRGLPADEARRVAALVERAWREEQEAPAGA